MDAQQESAINDESEPGKKSRSFPSAPTILVGVILLVWIATFFIPSGQYARDANGQPQPGSWEPTDLGLTFMDRVALLFESPPNGLYGVQDLDSGLVGPWNVGVIFGGAQVFLFILAIGGFMTVVFRTGALDDGIGLRLLLLVLCMAAMIWYTVRYARRVQADPSKSLVGFDDLDEHVRAQGHALELEPLTAMHKVVVALVGFTFALLTFSIIPWGAILHNVPATDYPYSPGPEPFSWDLGWWLPELTVLFLVMAIVIGIVARLGEKEIVGNFLKGVADFSGPASLVVLAKAVSVILTNTQTVDTVLNAMEGIVSGANSIGFVLGLAVISLPLGFLVGTGSAGMALVMPILAPLGDFAEVDRSMVVSTYAAMGAWLNLVLPINVLLMAGLGLARVGFDVYLRWIGKLMGILLVIVLAVLILGTLI